MLANLKTERKGAMEDKAKGLLREWGDMLALVCHHLEDRIEVQCLLEGHRQNDRSTWAWHRVATGSRDQERETNASGRGALWTVNPLMCEEGGAMKLGSLLLTLITGK